MTLPALHIKHCDQWEATINLSIKYNDTFQFQKLRQEFVSHIKNSLYKTNCFSKKILNEHFNERRKYIDESMIDFAKSIYLDNFKKQKLRNYVYQQFALDRFSTLKTFNPNTPYVVETLIHDIYISYKDKVNYSTLRNIEIIWKHFLKSHNLKISEECKKKISKFLSLKVKADMLDSEVIPILIQGHYVNQDSLPVLFSTMDPLENLAIRISVYKFVLINVFQIVNNNNDLPITADGEVLIFDKELNLLHILPISKIEPIDIILNSGSISSWIETLKTTCTPYVMA